MSGDSHTGGDETREANVAETAGAWVGRYRLLQQLGEGGFGVVFLAEQTEPIKRQVALKIIKLGMDTRQVVARFEQERQALAVMDHPNIARVIDGGATDSGRPYFVMELVRGEPLTDFCDRNLLPIPDRLRLMILVCHAVQHAHQKGLIHRDLKPSNVLVTMVDGVAVPKVIDFGITKAIAAKLTDRTLYTELHQMIGTPGYMSPEQAEGSLDIDTRTDIYSLGAILYELVTGSTPFDRDDLRKAGPLDLVRMIREVDPPSPSRRVSQSGDVAAIAARRGTDPTKLAVNVRGELDWIALKAIDKDRSRRYEAASGLAMDLKRYLTGDAVLAAPPSTVYRLKKFVVRHKAAVAGAAVIALVVVLGLAGTLWQASVASHERDAARREAATSKAVTEFVINSLETQDVTAQGQQDMTVAAAMNQAAARIEAGDLKDEPEVAATLLRTIAIVLDGNSKSAAALPMAEKALALERRTHGTGDNEHVAAAMATLGTVNISIGKYTDAEPLMRETVAMQKRLGLETPVLVESLNDWGAALVGQRKFAEAVPMTEEALRIGRRIFPNGHRQIGVSLTNLGYCKRNLGDLESAERLYQEAIEADRTFFKGDHSDIAIILANIGAMRRGLKRYPEAMAAFDEALAMNRRLFKEDNMTRAALLLQMSSTNRSLGKLAEADDQATQSISMMKRLFPNGHVNIVRALTGQAGIRSDRGNTAGALALAREAAAMQARVAPADAAAIESINQLIATIQKNAGSGKR